MKSNSKAQRSKRKRENAIQDVAHIANNITTTLATIGRDLSVLSEAILLLLEDK